MPRTRGTRSREQQHRSHGPARSSSSSPRFMAAGSVDIRRRGTRAPRRALIRSASVSGHGEPSPLSVRPARSTSSAPLQARGRSLVAGQIAPSDIGLPSPVIAWRVPEETELLGEAALRSSLNVLYGKPISRSMLFGLRGMRHGCTLLCRTGYTLKSRRGGLPVACRDLAPQIRRSASPEDALRHRGPAR